ncbi:dockerin type I repeat-containing protein [Ruminococcus sp.]|uniref:dockerin type I repeat-containing protein n=1 Tax=Ruminococcus sp. TaxID=41978 RepID=UPI002E81F7AA|nr:dockerin type I repeat-containing protein [Ruminococcus sp.]MEE3491410.1 dockerin type I repeat-containing protein [Ruminococcus sp.]
MKRKVVSLILVLTLAVGLLPMSAFADTTVDLSGCELLYDGEGWKVFPIENKDDSLNVDDLKITVVDKEGREVPKDAYDLVFGMTYWDEEKDEDVFIPASAPFSLTVNGDYMQSGFGGFAAYAVAKDNSGYTGQTGSPEFMLWHKYSFNWFGSNADFGEEYRGQCTWSWHDYFAIPANEMHAPVIHGIAYEDVDPQYYELTYFERGEQPDFDDPTYDQKLYPETDPLDGMPTDPGKYFVRIDGKEPYYGTSYVDFDIVQPSLNDCEVLIDGEGWKVFPVENLNDLLSIDDLNITVVDRNGKPLSEDAYLLNIGMQIGWDDDENMPIISEVPAPYGVIFDSNDEELSSGFTTYRVNAVAKNDSDYTGSTEARNFLIWHKYSFNWFGANADFGEEYKAMSQMTWHDRYEIPSNRIKPPVIHGIAWEDEIDPQFYEITYFVRHNEEIEGVENPVDLDDEKERRRYSEEEPLEDLPTEEGKYFARIDGKAPYYGSSYVDFDVVAPDNPRFEDDVEILFNGYKEWEKSYYIDSKDQKLTLEDLDISVVTNGGDTVDPDLYELHIGIQTGYDDEKHEPIIEPVEEPFGLTSDEAQIFGWQMHCVKATAKENSGFEGETRVYEFMIRDKRSLERDGSFIDFGEQYIKPAHRSWHYYFEIPQDELRAPDVYDCTGKKLDPSMYTLTYFERFDEYDSFDMIYSESKPLESMPTEEGSYFARLDANDPYYGKSYVDFDVVGETVSYAMVRRSDRRYYEGDTIYISQNDDIYVCFDISPNQGMIPGWRDSELQRFGCEYQPPFEGESNSYAHIIAPDQAGVSETLYYDWYRAEDIFDEYGGMHWDTAEPVLSCSVILAVLPDEYDYLLGDADGDGEITIMDATIIQRYLADFPVGVSANVLMQGDVDEDDDLTIADASFIQRRLADIRIPYDIGKPMTLQ